MPTFEAKTLDMVLVAFQALLASPPTIPMRDFLVDLTPRITASNMTSRVFFILSRTAGRDLPERSASKRLATSAMEIL